MAARTEPEAVNTGIWHATLSLVCTLDIGYTNSALQHQYTQSSNALPTSSNATAVLKTTACNLEGHARSSRPSTWASNANRGVLLRHKQTGDLAGAGHTCHQEEADPHSQAKAGQLGVQRQVQRQAELPQGALALGQHLRPRRSRASASGAMDTLSLCLSRAHTHTHSTRTCTCTQSKAKSARPANNLQLAMQEAAA